MQDAKDKAKEKPTKPGTEYLESASDEKPKKAPTKKPETKSENEVDYKISGFGAFLQKQAFPWRQALREALSHMKTTVPAGAVTGGAVGGIHGAIAPGEGRSRGKEALRRALLGIIMGTGLGAGGALTRSFMPNLRNLPLDESPLFSTLEEAVGGGIGGMGTLTAGEQLLGSYRPEPEKAASVSAPMQKAALPAVVMRALQSAGLGAGAGAGIGGLHGAFRGKKENESRLMAILRGLLVGAGTGAGIGAGASLGLSATGAGREARRLRDLLGELRTAPKTYGKTGQRAAKDLASARQALEDFVGENLGATSGLPLLGAAGGGAAGLAGGRALFGKDSSFGEFVKRAMGTMGAPAEPFGMNTFGDEIRKGMKSGNRQDMFDALARWSLGRE